MSRPHMLSCAALLALVPVLSQAGVVVTPVAQTVNVALVIFDQSVHQTSQAAVDHHAGHGHANLEMAMAHLHGLGAIANKEVVHLSVLPGGNASAFIGDLRVVVSMAPDGTVSASCSNGADAGTQLVIEAGTTRLLDVPKVPGRVCLVEAPSDDAEDTLVHHDHHTH